MPAKAMDRVRIRGRGRDEVTIQERSVNRQDGTYESMLTFEVPRDLEPGDYTMTFRVRGGGLRASGDTTFTLVALIGAACRTALVPHLI